MAMPYFSILYKEKNHQFLLPSFQTVNGIKQGQAYAWSRTRMGGWAVAQSPILGTTITLKRLKKRGYQSMLDYYLKVKF